MLSKNSCTKWAIIFIIVVVILVLMYNYNKSREHYESNRNKKTNKNNNNNNNGLRMELRRLWNDRTILINNYLNEISKGETYKKSLQDLHNNELDFGNNFKKYYDFKNERGMPVSSVYQGYLRAYVSLLSELKNMNPEQKFNYYKSFEELNAKFSKFLNDTNKYIDKQETKNLLDAYTKSLFKEANLIFANVGDSTVNQEVKTKIMKFSDYFAFNTNKIKRG